ncbi:MAG: hypothetical protein ACE5Q5_05185 [Nitrosarchaeum sp.]
MANNGKTLNNTRDTEFKISISTEDIDDIVQLLENMKNTSKSFEENIIKAEDE